MSHATFESFSSLFLVLELIHGTQMEDSTDFYIGIMENDIYMNNLID